MFFSLLPDDAENAQHPIMSEKVPDGNQKPLFYGF